VPEFAFLKMMVLLEDIVQKPTVYIQRCGLVVHGSAVARARFRSAMITAPEPSFKRLHQRECPDYANGSVREFYSVAFRRKLYNSPFQIV
jgi:hypothetical protein